MQNVGLLLLVLLAGMVQPFHIAMNAKIMKVTGSPAVAGMVTFVGGAVVATLLWLTHALPRGEPAKLASAPWWVWPATVLGLYVIVSALVATPKTGSAIVIVLLVSGQTIMSLLIDHYGWLDVKRTPVNAWRVGGVVMIVGGTLMMMKR